MLSRVPPPAHVLSQETVSGYKHTPMYALSRGCSDDHVIPPRTHRRPHCPFFLTLTFWPRIQRFTQCPLLLQRGYILHTQVLRTPVLPCMEDFMTSRELCRSSLSSNATFLGPPAKSAIPCEFQAVIHYLFCLFGACTLASTVGMCTTSMGA